MRNKWKRLLVTMLAVITCTVSSVAPAFASSVDAWDEEPIVVMDDAAVEEPVIVEDETDVPIVETEAQTEEDVIEEDSQDAYIPEEVLVEEDETMDASIVPTELVLQAGTKTVNANVSASSAYKLGIRNMTGKDLEIKVDTTITAFNNGASQSSSTYAYLTVGSNTPQQMWSFTKKTAASTITASSGVTTLVMIEAPSSGWTSQNIDVEIKYTFTVKTSTTPTDPDPENPGQDTTITGTGSYSDPYIIPVNVGTVEYTLNKAAGNAYIYFQIQGPNKQVTVKLSSNQDIEYISEAFDWVDPVSELHLWPKEMSETRRIYSDSVSSRPLKIVVKATNYPTTNTSKSKAIAVTEKGYKTPDPIYKMSEKSGWFKLTLTGHRVVMISQNLEYNHGGNYTVYKEDGTTKIVDTSCYVDALDWDSKSEKKNLGSDFVSDGVITFALKAGTYYIKKASLADGLKTTIKVRDYVPVTAAAVSKTKITLYDGETSTIKIGDLTPSNTDGYVKKVTVANSKVAKAKLKTGTDSQRNNITAAKIYTSLDITGVGFGTTNVYLWGDTGEKLATIKVTSAPNKVFKVDTDKIYGGSTKMFIQSYASTCDSIVPVSYMRVYKKSGSSWKKVKDLPAGKFGYVGNLKEKTTYQFRLVPVYKDVDGKKIESKGTPKSFYVKTAPSTKPSITKITGKSQGCTLVETWDGEWIGGKYVKWRTPSKDYYLASRGGDVYWKTVKGADGYIIAGGAQVVDYVTGSHKRITLVTASASTKSAAISKLGSTVKLQIKTYAKSKSGIYSYGEYSSVKTFSTK